MAIKDLNQWLEVLEKEGELARVETPGGLGLGTGRHHPGDL